MFFVIALVVSTVLLHFYFRWALIDPQRISARHRPLAIFVRAFILSAALLVADGVAETRPSYAMHIVFSLILGFILGPALTAPELPNDEDKQRMISRWVSAKRRAILGRWWLKLFFIIPLTAVLKFLGVPLPWYYAAGMIALFLCVAKTGIVFKAVTDEKNEIKIMLSYREWEEASMRLANPLLDRSILLLSLVGSFSLAVWLGLAIPVVISVPHLRPEDWIHVVGVVLGAVMSLVF